MSAAANQVLVVGGRIGGLATALALSRKGIPVQVLEQAPEFMSWLYGEQPELPKVGTIPLPAATRLDS